MPAMYWMCCRSDLTEATQQIISFLNFMKVYESWPLVANNTECLVLIFPHSQFLPSDPGTDSNYTMGWTTAKLGFDSQRWQKTYFLNTVQTGSEAHPASYPMGTGGCFPGVKRPKREADHSPSPSAQVDYVQSCTSTSLYVFME
jgi:hypothetical protein